MSFMLFGGPTAHGHSGQALAQRTRKNGAPPALVVQAGKATRHWVWSGRAGTPVSP